MAQDVGDDVKRCSLLKELRCQRMAQGMQAAALPGSESDARQLPPIRDHVMQMTILGNRGKGQPCSQEHFAIGGVGTPRFEVVDQRRANFLRHRQAQGRARLRLLDFNGGGVPFEIIQFQRPDVAQSQSQAVGEQEHRIIALAPRRRAIDHLEQFHDQLRVPD